MKELYNKFLKITENEKITEQKFNIRILTSVFTIFLSIVMLCSTTLAFFTNNATTGIETMKSAEYGAAIIVEKGQGENKTAETLTDYSYICQDKDLYTFGVKAEGTASTGYIEITVTAPGQPDITLIKVLEPNTEPPFKVILTADAGTKITFNPVWGTPGENVELEDGAELTIELVNLSSVLIEEEIATPQFIMHTVEEGETLESIAEHYGLTIEELCEYNDIPADTILIAGSEIAIPVVPDDTTGEETEGTEETAPQFNIHTVAEDETLETIAALYSITVEELCEYNAITADAALTIGQELKIPVKEQGEETEDELLTEELPEPSPSPSASPAPEQTEEPAITPEISLQPSTEPVEIPKQDDIPETLPVPSPETSPEGASEPAPETGAQPAETPDGTPETTPELTEVISSDEAASPDVTPSADASPAALDELQGENSES